MFILIEQRESLYLQDLSLLFLAFSFLFLLCFGMRMIDQKFEKYPIPYLLPILASFPIAVFILVSQSDNSLLAANIFMRYFVGFPGIILTAFAFYIRLEDLKDVHLQRVKLSLKILIVTFLLYAFSAGLIVPDAPYPPASIFNYSNFKDTFGFPIQLLRTVLAIVSMIAVIEVLNIFSLEADLKLKKLASIDSLTGIFNRMKFDEHLLHEISNSRRYHHPLSIIMLDIDYFKKINDTYGHIEGDFTLKIIADIIKKNIRESDIYARWGGEEFVILMPNTTQKESMVFADRLRMEIEVFDFKNIGPVTASFGVAQSQKEEPVHSFMKRVDDALYQSKKAGRNRVSSYSADS